MRPSSPAAPILLLIAVAAVAGCGGATANDSPTTDASSLDHALVDDTADTAAAASQSSGLTRPLFVAVDARLVGADPSGEASKQVQAASAKVLASYQPAGCAALSSPPAEPGRVRLTLTDCTTPAGLEHVTGEIEAVFSGEPGRVHVDLSAPTLSARGTAIAYSASADLVSSDGTQTITWRTTTWRATTPHGTVVSHTADYTISVDLATRCSITAGSTRGQVDATQPDGTMESRGLDTVIDDFGLCPGACPSSGTIRSTGERTRHTIVLRFDGASAAHVTGAHGATFELPLTCGG